LAGDDQAALRHELACSCPIHRFFANVPTMTGKKKKGRKISYRRNEMSNSAGDMRS
jgi:hypothetical protein